MFKNVCLSSEGFIAVDYNGTSHWRASECVSKLLNKNFTLTHCALGENDQYVLNSPSLSSWNVTSNDLDALLDEGDYNKVFFGTGSSYFVTFYSGTHAYSGIPVNLHKRLNGRQRSRGGVETIAFSDDSYFVQFTDGSSWFSPNIPEGIQAFARNHYVAEISMANNFGEWYVCSSTGEEDYCSANLRKIEDKLDSEYDNSPNVGSYNEAYARHSTQQYPHSMESLYNVAQDLQYGHLRPQDIPSNSIVFANNKWYGLDERKLSALRRSGINFNIGTYGGSNTSNCMININIM